MRNRERMLYAVMTAGLLGSAGMMAQNAAPPAPAKAAAPVDFTGYWVSQIVDEWRFRVTPQKGDILYMPLNAEARRMATAWDPAKDEADGKQCKAYGAIGVMQRPGRLHITWADDNTLKIETDAGTQTRLIHFTRTAAGERSWQGDSFARWDTSAMPRGFGERNNPRKPDTLIVETNNMLPGYLRKNGVPYSEKAVMTEHFNRLTGAESDDYLADTAEVVDPTYLVAPFVRTYLWKKVPDSSGWDPTPCWTH